MREKRQREGVIERGGERGEREGGVREGGVGERGESGE